MEDSKARETIRRWGNTFAGHVEGLFRTLSTTGEGERDLHMSDGDLGELQRYIEESDEEPEEVYLQECCNKLLQDLRLLSKVPKSKPTRSDAIDVAVMDAMFARDRGVARVLSLSRRCRHQSRLPNAGSSSLVGNKRKNLPPSNSRRRRKEGERKKHKTKPSSAWPKQWCRWIVTPQS